MNPVHLHLLLNHLPVIGAVAGALLLALPLVWRSAPVVKLSLGFLAVVGAMSVLVYLTGEPAEETIERLPGFSEQLVNRHEDAALVATIVTATLGALAAGALIIYRRKAVPRWLTMLGLLGALGSGAVMGYTANLGGQIRHPEIRSGGALTGPSQRGNERGDRDEP